MRNGIVRLNTLIMVGPVLSACCVGWWIGDTAAPTVMSTIRPVDVPEPYYTAQQNDSLGLNDLDVALHDLRCHTNMSGVYLIVVRRRLMSSGFSQTGGSTRQSVRVIVIVGLL